MKTELPAKIIVAWGEAIGGNKDIRDWLMKNGYPELGLFVFALHNKEDAREWLMENGHPHLMALIRGVEGDKNALLWLDKHQFDLLKWVARAGDNDDGAVTWLVNHDYRDFATLGLKIRMVKNAIEDSNNDVHKIHSSG